MFTSVYREAWKMVVAGWLLVIGSALVGGIIAPGLQPIDYDIHVPFAETLRNFQTNPATHAHVKNHVNDWVKRSQKIFQAGGNSLTGVDNYSCVEPKIKKALAESVHALTPADISVVAALGDSMTAGMGAGAQSLAEDTLEYRGLSFSIGGDGDLLFTTTIPNILRRFNSNIVGASHRVSPVWYKLFSQFNVAVSGARTPGLYLQATDLVKRMQESDQVDLKNDWKLVTILIGANDICDYCKDPDKYSASNYTKNLRAAIDHLKEHLPRTVVNLVSLINVHMLKATHSISQGCQLLHSQECPCLIEMQDDDFHALLRSYQDQARKLEELEEYQTDDQFVVIVSPALEQETLPLNAANEPELAYLAPDCFHPSQLGHSLLAKLIWNNLFEPFGDKTTVFDTSYPISITLSCPNSNCPFLRTSMNTLNCSLFQDTSVSSEERKHFMKQSFSMISPSRAFAMKKQSLTDAALLNFHAQPLSNPSKIVYKAESQTYSSFAGVPLIVLTACLALISAGLIAFIFATRKQNRSRQIDERTPLLADFSNRIKVY